MTPTVAGSQPCLWCRDINIILAKRMVTQRVLLLQSDCRVENTFYLRSSLVFFLHFSHSESPSWKPVFHSFFHSQ